MGWSGRIIAPSRPIASCHALQLLQAVQVLGRGFAGIDVEVVLIGHFADVDVAARIHADAVRGKEFADLLARAVLASQARDALAVLVDEGETRTAVRGTAIDC